MTSTAPPKTPPSRRWRDMFLIIVLLGIVSLAVWMILHHLNTWQGINDAKAALERGDIKTARQQLQHARQVYPDSDEICFLFAQALRRDGDYTEARRTLNEAKRLGWIKDAIELELVLLNVQEALYLKPPNWAAFPEESFLREAVRKKHPEAPQICEALIPAALARHEGAKATFLVGRWLELQPDHGLALYWKGRLAEFHHDPTAASDAYRSALDKLPAHKPARRALLALLLDQGRLTDVEQHLAQLEANDAHAPTLKARYLVQKQQTDEARSLLNSLLETSPKDAELLQLRGQLELDANKPTDAEPFLRQAYQLDGYRLATLEPWQRCLTALDKSTEAREVQTRLDAVKADQARLPELVAQSTATPTDPEPRRQLGEALLRLNRPREGLGWLESALHQDPKNAPALEALANYFEKVGQKALADQYRAAAKAPPPK